MVLRIIGYDIKVNWVFPNLLHKKRKLTVTWHCISNEMWVILPKIDAYIIMWVCPHQSSPWDDEIFFSLIFIQKMINIYQAQLYYHFISLFCLQRLLYFFVYFLFVLLLHSFLVPEHHLYNKPTWTLTCFSPTQILVPSFSNKGLCTKLCFQESELFQGLFLHTIIKKK